MTTVLYPFDTDQSSIIVTQSPNGDFSHSGYFASGWDFSLAAGTQVTAICDAQVIGIENSVGEGEAGPSNLGNYVTLSVFAGSSHQFYVTYMHLSAGSDLNIYQTVSAGDLIGTIGLTGFTTGYHLHIQASQDLITLRSGAVIANGTAEYADLVTFNEAATGQVPLFELSGSSLSISDGGGSVYANLRSDRAIMRDTGERVDISGVTSIRGSEYGDRTLGDGRFNDFTGYGGNDTLRGRGGHDNLSGGRGNDRLFGNHGWDHIDGGRGRDVIVGGRGDDVLNGGSGADRFVFATRSGDDIISDFGNGNDTIILRGHAAEDVWFTHQGDSAVIHLSERDMITVQGVSARDIADHIVFA